MIHNVVIKYSIHEFIECNSWMLNSFKVPSVITPVWFSVLGNTKYAKQTAKRMQQRDQKMFLLWEGEQGNRNPNWKYTATR